MQPIEIVIIVVVSIIVVSIIGVYIYKKIKHIPTGECGCCSSKPKNIVKEYHKQYGKKDHKCCCSKEKKG